MSSKKDKRNNNNNNNNGNENKANNHKNKRDCKANDHKNKKDYKDNKKNINKQTELECALTKLPLENMKDLAVKMNPKSEAYLKVKLNRMRCNQLIKHRTLASEKQCSRALGFIGNRQRQKKIKQKKREENEIKVELRKEHTLELRSISHARQRQFFAGQWAKLVIAPVYIETQTGWEYNPYNIKNNSGFIKYLEIIKRPELSKLNQSDGNKINESSGNEVNRFAGKVVLRFKEDLTLKSNYYSREDNAPGKLAGSVPITFSSYKNIELSLMEQDRSFNYPYYCSGANNCVDDYNSDILRITWYKILRGRGEIDWIEFLGGDCVLFVPNVHMVVLNVCYHDFDLPLDICKIILSFGNVRD